MVPAQVLELALEERRRRPRHLSGGVKKVVVFAGTRPEAIKVAPVVHALRSYPEYFDVCLCSTGQHREILAQSLADFGLRPDVELAVMSDNQTLSGLSSALYLAINEFFQNVGPDAVLLQGDTTSAQVASLCAFYAGIPVGHIEAGLRTGDIDSPFPEELNRRITGMVARWHFAPTATAAQRLLEEHVDPARVLVTGNTIVDALQWMSGVIQTEKPPLPPRVEAAIAENRPLIVVTSHRRESFGRGIYDICSAMLELAGALPEARLIYPVHPNPNVHGLVHEMLNGRPNIYLESPIGYKPFVRLLTSCRLILSDSGGIQEEGPSLGKPVLVMRDATERPEGVECGVNLLVGTDPARIVGETMRLMIDDKAYRRMAACKNPFGDGKAAERITACLQECLIGVEASCRFRN